MFIHSIKAPRFYKQAALIAKKVKEDGASIKMLIYEKKHPNIKGIYALVLEVLQQHTQLDFLIKKSKLFEKEPRLDPWLARILITELLWGKKQLPGESKPVKTVLAYEQILKAHMTDIHSCEKTTKVQKPRYVRVNTLKLSLNEAVESFRDEGWTFFRYMDVSDYTGFLERVANMSDDEFLVDIHLDNLLVFPANAQFYKHPAYLDGQIILQDKASCLPVQILNASPGSVALDMCAAPGMKTTQLAAHMNNEGTIFAVEMDQKRLETLNKMLESAGVTCVTVLNKDVVTVTDKDIPGVEYILVDPTCSGSGIVNRLEVENKFEPVEQRVAKLAGFQIKILKHALKRFPDAKRIVYSTCSIYPQENEDVVAEVISSSTKFKLVPVQSLLKAPWSNVASTEEGSVGSYCIYARPEDDLTNGFFVAAFERLADGESNVFLKERTYVRNDQMEENNEKDFNTSETNRWKGKKNDPHEERIMTNISEEIGENNTSGIDKKKKRRGKHNTNSYEDDSEVKELKNDENAENDCSMNIDKKWILNKDDLQEISESNLQLKENDAELKIKKKKKNRKSAAEDNDAKKKECDETLDDNVDDIHQIKKKKKKNKVNTVELPSIDNSAERIPTSDCNLIENDAELKIKKKKKNRKSAADEDIQLECNDVKIKETDETLGDNVGDIHQIKKKNKVDTNKLSGMNNSTEQISTSDCKVTKKKKKSKAGIEELQVVERIPTSDVGVTKKRRDLDVNENDGVIEKKKRKKCAVEELKTDVMPSDEIPKKKEKKKKRKTVVNVDDESATINDASASEGVIKGSEDLLVEEVRKKGTMKRKTKID